MRFTHSGGYYDTRKSTAGFYEPSWNRANAPRLYRPVCTTRVPGNQTCAANNQRAVDLANPTVLLPSAFIGNLVPGTGSQINGMVADGYPGHAAGRVLRATAARGRAAGRLRLGHQRRRQAGAAGLDGSFLRHSPRAETGRTSSATRRRPSAASVQWATFGDIENFANSNIAFVETPINAQYAGGERRSLEKSYNVNVTYQRDIGFNTTAEVAYVGAFTYSGGRTDGHQPAGQQPVSVLADPSRMFNGNALGHATSCARTIRAWGAINKWIDQSDGDTVNAQTLRYNSMQLSVQRRLNRGLQMGLAYTLAKGEGWNGWNPDVLEADPTGELNRIWFWGPTDDNRTHNLCVNYSYMIPNALPNTPIAKWLLGRLAGVGRHEVPERHGDAT